MKTILITGVSTGLGRSIALEALARGHRVIGTLRKERQRAEFEMLEPGRSIGRILDVTDQDAIKPLVQDIEKEFGAIDILINNAGYGLRGIIEELDLDALRQQYDVNVFAPVALIQAVLPSMRERRSGHIVNMVSMGGIIAFPNLGAYNSSKFAFLGINESLEQEVKSLGIKVTAIMPGVYRSDWASRSQAQTESKIADYDAITGADPDMPWGDPTALGRVTLDAIEMDEPPEHLLVGPVALDLVRKRLAKWTAEIDRWEELSYADGEG